MSFCTFLSYVMSHPLKYQIGGNSDNIIGLSGEKKDMRTIL